MEGCIEIWKAIRVIVWAFCLIILFVWKRFLCCKSSDNAFDEITERVEHKHPMEECSWGSSKKEIRPKTFHERAKQLDPVPILYPETAEELKRIAEGNARFRAIGSGHSFRAVVETNGILVSLEKMNKILKLDGIKIRHAIWVLEEHGLALRTWATTIIKVLTGLLSEARTSGSKRTNTFSSSLGQMKMINAKGKDVLLGPETL